jgi:hypothetical protein
LDSAESEKPESWLLCATAEADSTASSSLESLLLRLDDPRGSRRSSSELDSSRMSSRTGVDLADVAVADRNVVLASESDRDAEADASSSSSAQA